MLLIVLRRGTRSLGNHDEVVSALMAFSQKSSDLRITPVVVDSANLTVEAQATAFRAASIVVSPHGSGLANCIFLRESAVVIELLPWEYPNLTFYVALSWLPLRHVVMVVDGANAYGPMMADVEALVAHVRTLRSEQLGTSELSWAVGVCRRPGGVCESACVLASGVRVGGGMSAEWSKASKDMRLVNGALTLVGSVFFIGKEKGIPRKQHVVMLPGRHCQTQKAVRNRSPKPFSPGYPHLGPHAPASASAKFAGIKCVKALGSAKNNATSTRFVTNGKGRDEEQSELDPHATSVS